MNRVLSLIHSWFTPSWFLGRMRMTSRPFVSTRMFDPRASITSIVSVFFSSHGLAVNAYGLEVKAPTGQRSMMLPCKFDVSVRLR